MRTGLPDVFLINAVVVFTWKERVTKRAEALTSRSSAVSSILKL